MMMNGLGLAETLAGLRGLLQQARRLVGPGGQILADSTDVRVRMDREAARRGTLERPDGRYGWWCEILLAPDEYGNYLARLTPR